MESRVKTVVLHKFCIHSIVNVLKFQTVGEKSLDEQGRPRSSLIRVFPVCFSDKHFVSSSPDNQFYLRI